MVIVPEGGKGQVGASYHLVGHGGLNKVILVGHILAKPAPGYALQVTSKDEAVTLILSQIS